MRIVPPIFTWNKGILKLSARGSRITQKPWLLGVILLVCVVIAMLLANIPQTGHVYHEILKTNIQLHLFSTDGGTDILFPKDMTVEKFINDILMVMFFFVVGLEIKREFASGALSSPKKAMLPVVAAFGGVLVPALIYIAINRGTAASSGWGIPTATDIAFAVCIISMLGDRVPLSLKVFLTALAVTDDLIAILVVILFYGGGVRLGLMAVSLAVIAFVFLMRKLGEKRMFPYMLCTLIVWILVYYSGIHATMSGVVMAFLIPSAPLYNKSQYYHKRNRLIARLDQLGTLSDEPFPNTSQRRCLRKLEAVAHGSMDMSYRIEHTLTPAARKAHRHNPVQLARRQAENRRDAREERLGHARGRRLPRRHRLHDVHLHRHSLLRRPERGGDARPQGRRQDCGPDGLRVRRSAGLAANLHLRKEAED